MNARFHVSLTVLTLAMVVAVKGTGQSDNSANRARIVFVCEHGAAKSVIATAYFNKVAAERGLRERATYGVASPQSELSAATLKGLRDDGLAVPTSKPAAITSDDVNSATHIFAIGCSLPTENWTDVPEVSDGYAASRDAIIETRRTSDRPSTKAMNHLRRP